MSTETPAASLSEDNGGCISFIFKLFQSHHSFKRLLPVPGSQSQKKTQCATKALTQKEVKAHIEKSRISMESSSSGSSLDSNRTAQQQKTMRTQVNILTSSSKTTSKKEHHRSLIPKMQSLDLRDVVKDSMHRETRVLSIKSRSPGERRSHPMKHIDSPRPFFQQRKTEESPIENSTLARWSFDDGRESQESLKFAMKLKEMARLSLDSRTSSMNNSYSRTGSFGVVAKLMGLEDNGSLHTQSPTKADKSNQTQVSENNPRCRISHSMMRTRCTSTVAMEPGARVRNLSYSVYGEIEKRITKLDHELVTSGKDLRALKKILEAMQKRRERSERNSNSFIQRRDKVIGRVTDRNSKEMKAKDAQRTIEIDRTMRGSQDSCMKCQENQAKRKDLNLLRETPVHKTTSSKLFEFKKKRLSPKGLLKEVDWEIENLLKMSYYNLDDGDYSGEVPALVLDIERLIFKDLINEIIIRRNYGTS